MNTRLDVLRKRSTYDADQRRFLEHQLQKLSDKKERYLSDDKLIQQAPAWVRDYAKRVNRYLKSARREAERPNIRLAAAIAEIREEMLFGDPRKALVMLRKAMKRKFL